MARRAVLSAVFVSLVLMAIGAGTAGAERPIRGIPDALAQLGSGPASQPVVAYGTGLTECPQAGIKPESQPRPLDRRQPDKVEQVSQGGNEQRTNFEYSCFPQDETSIAVNPVDPRNAVAGANDYRLGWGTSGFYSTTDNGNNWYTQIIPFPSLPSGDNLDGGGDPALVYDRNGTVYYADINFNRTDDTNGIFVSRSTNGGFTWSRPCVPIDATPADPTDNAGRCGGAGDPRQPGDGNVTFQQDQDMLLNGSVPFNDKEYIAAGPRPAGVAATCFGAFTRTPVACPPGTVGPDRIYVTWTLFTNTDANIMLSYSDDMGRSWSAAKAISGSAPFCFFGVANNCDFNQFSTPTVSPATGALYVAFENFNTPEENQYLLVRSLDGGNTVQGPFFITPVYDVNYPRSGSSRPDCGPRGQQGGRRVLNNSCFRVNSGGNVVVDRRGGPFADDLYLVMSDNRHGLATDSNTDVFLFKSIDGGSTWVGPTRVNNDASKNDNWFPWADIGTKGDLTVNFYDRRNDTTSTAREWPTSFTEPGNYLVWRFGAVCSVTTADSRECVQPNAAPIPQPPPLFDPPDAPLVDTQTVFPLKNFTLSDTPSNWDYSFRGGIFAGDYDVVAIGPDNTAWSTWTDARNGRSSRNQTGRNPACEQSDAFFERYSAQSGGAVKGPAQTDSLFLVTPCPTDIQEP